jgi:hypothetical protein
LAALLQLSDISSNCDAKNAYVSFSKVTAADFGASAASDEGVTEREVILPLMDVSIAVWPQSPEQHGLPEAEEVSDLLLACLRGNAPDMDCVRHFEGFATE